MDEPCIGLPADRAVWELLALRGWPGSFPAFRELHEVADEPERMAELLQALGSPARASRIQVEELRFLDLPGLVQVQDGGWLLLEARGRDGLRAATGGGRRWLPARTVQARMTGRILELAPTLPAGSSLWIRLRPLFLRHRGVLARAGAVTLALQALALVPPAITAQVMDRALPDGAGSRLALLVAGLALATAHQVGLGWFRDRALLFLGSRIEAAAERGFLEHVLRCPFPFLQARTQGDLMQAMAGFTAARDLLPLKTVGVLLDGSLAVFYLAAMVLILPAAGLAILLGTLVLGGLALLAGRIQAGLEVRQVAAEVRAQGLLIELVTGIATLKGAGAEGHGLARWRQRYREVLGLEARRGQVDLWADLAMTTLGQAVAVGLFGYGGLRLLDGTLAVGRLFAFLQLSGGFSAAFLGLVHTAIQLMVLKPQIAKAEEIFRQPAEPRPRPQPSAGQVPVRMEGVWFRYGPERPWVLQGYDLELEAGAHHELEGPSGSGKSTVLRLLAGLLVPERGRVLLAGRPPADLRQDLVYLPQFVRIFGGSVEDNLRLFSSGAPRDRIHATAAATGLAALVAHWPMGYQTLLSPGGRSLSGGQRQLIALTGAMASGRPLLLLDEALANLDPLHAAPLRELLHTGPWTLVSARHPQSDRP